MGINLNERGWNNVDESSTDLDKLQPPHDELSKTIPSPTDEHPIDTPLTPTEKGISTPFPTPRTYEGKDYYGAEDVANIIGVTRRNVLYWHQRGYFTADKRAHDGRYLYEIERVMQLKSVYRSDWNQPAYLAHVEEPKEITPVEASTAATKTFDVKEVAALMNVPPSIVVRLTVKDLILPDWKTSRILRRLVYTADAVEQFKQSYSDEWVNPEFSCDAPAHVDTETFAQLNLVSAWNLTNLPCIKALITKITNKARKIGPKPTRFICPFCGSLEMQAYDDETGTKITPKITQWKCDCLHDSYKLNEDIIAVCLGLDARRDRDLIFAYAKQYLPNLGEVSEPSTKPVDNNVGIFADTPADPLATPPVDEKTQRVLNDLKQAREEFANLPDDQKRGLRDETFLRLYIGFINRWVSPSAPNTLPTPRFIARLGEDGDTPSYNAIMTPDGRERFKNSDKWEANKCLSAGKKLVFNPAALNEKLVFVTEGEIDTASICQCASFTLAACALGSASNFDDLKKRLRRLNSKPAVIVLLDRDSKSGTGQLYAPKLVAELTAMHVPAVAKFFEDVMTDDEIAVLADKKGKVDANQILQRGGDATLKTLLDRIIADAKPRHDELIEQFKDAPPVNSADGSTELPNHVAGRKTKHGSHSQNISPKLQQLLDEVKSIPWTKDDIKALLTPAKKSGVICPECGNGSGSGGTGATIYTSPPGVHCHKCNKWHLDGFDLFALSHNLETTGKNFFTTLRAALDEYAIPYDPKDFEFKSARSNIFADDIPVDIPDDNVSAENIPVADVPVADTPTVPETDPKIVEWEIVNGKIDPQLLPEIDGAAKYLNRLTIENLTAEIAQSPKTKRAVALCKFYNFTNVADIFFTLLQDAKDAARSAVQVAQSGASFADEITSDTKILARLPVTEFKTAVNKIVAELRKAHTKFQAVAKREAERAREQAKIDAREKNQYTLDKKDVDYLFSMDNTDYSNMQRILYLYGKYIRFNLSDEQWFRFDSKKGIWTGGSRKSNIIVQHFVNQTAEILAHNAPNPVDNPDSVDIINGWKSTKKTQLAINYMKGNNSIVIKPSDLDRHKNLLNCLNGVLDLQTGKFYPLKEINPAWLITKQCHAIWEGYDFTYGTVKNFFETLIPDKATLRALFSWVGYCLTGNVDQQIVHFWKGTGANGKTTLINFILDMFGTYGVKLPTAAILVQRNPSDANAATTALNPIEGARIAIFNELALNDRINGPLVKDLSGGDKFNLRPMFMNMREVHPTAKIVINGNFYPKPDNINDDGLLRRIRTLEFTQVFKSEEDEPNRTDRTEIPDVRLAEKLATPEALSAFLTIAAIAAREYYKVGKIYISPAMNTSRREYISDNDFLADFVDDYCDFGSNKYVEAKILLEKLRVEYPTECQQYTNNKELRNLILKRYPQLRYDRYTERKTKHFIGIGLVSPEANVAEANYRNRNNRNQGHDNYEQYDAMDVPPPDC